MDSPFLRKGRGHLLSNKQQEGACSRSIMATRIFLFFAFWRSFSRSSSLCSHQYHGQPPPRAWRQVPVRARPASRPPAAATALDGPGWSGGLLCARPRRAYKQYRGQPPPPRDAMGLRPARAAQAMPALMAFAAFSACAHLLPPRCRRRRSHFAQQWNYCLACQTQFFLEIWDLKKGLLLLYQHSHILVDQRRKKIIIYDETG